MRPGSGSWPTRRPMPRSRPARTRSSTSASRAGRQPDRLVSAMEQFKSLLRDRPGSTRVVLHVPAPGGGSALPMELRRGVAYDTELVAEVRRRLGEGVVELRLASA